MIKKLYCHVYFRLSHKLLKNNRLNNIAQLTQ